MRTKLSKTHPNKYELVTELLLTFEDKIGKSIKLLTRYLDKIEDRKQAYHSFNQFLFDVSGRTFFACSAEEKKLLQMH